ncbi:unnamed protein product [Blepharisma stoltei]|uniref:Uncharacterized protein n=1 Tax=Blepharisma stoltei TaxID=1481888 RepID=A0AAU9I9R2_9CILI|nr:unnamed protein product [Blepharisma stoltei]
MSQFATENFLKKIADLQSEIKIKEAQIYDQLKNQRKLEIDLEAMKKRYKEKEYENRRILEDNHRLRARFKEIGTFNFGENNEINAEMMEKEIIRRNEEIKRLQDQLKSQEKDFKTKLDGETRRLSKLVAEGDRKLIELKKFIKNSTEPKEENNVDPQFLTMLSELKEENKFLKQELAQKTIDPCMEDRIKELEEMQAVIIQENNRMKEELQSSLKDKGSGAYTISREINRISKDVHSLFEILNAFISGKEIPIRLLLTVQEPDIPSLYQMDRDFQTIRNDLNEIRTMIADYHAEQTGNNMCNTQ